MIKCRNKTARIYNIIILCVLVQLCSCDKQDNNINEKILENKRLSVSQLTNISIQTKWTGDSEALWGYEQADSILNLIPSDDINENIARIYQATSYVFYGSSYYNTILWISKNSSESTETVLSTGSLLDIIIKEIPDNLDSKELLLLEAKVNYAIAYSAYASELISSESLNSAFSYIGEINEIFEEIPYHNAECIATFINANIFFNSIIPILRSYYYARTNEEDAPEVILDITNMIDDLPFDDGVDGHITSDKLVTYKLRISEAQRTVLEMLSDEIMKINNIL